MRRTRSGITKVGVWLVACSAVAAALPLCAQAEGLQPLAVETSLYTGEGQGLCGLLSAGTPIEVLEQQGPWVKVRVEGWVRATAVQTPPVTGAALPPVGTDPPPPPALPHAAGLSAATPRVAAGAIIEGSVRVKRRLFKATSAAGVQLWLVPAAARAELEHENLSDADVQRLEALEAEAVRLGHQADRVLQEMSSFTQATQARDKLLAQREAVLADREQLLSARHGRHEAQARRSAVDSAVADSRGWFSFADAEPGAYTIYGRMVREGLDVEWLENVEAVASGTVRVDLDETRARGLLREPS